MFFTIVINIILQDYRSSHLLAGGSVSKNSIDPPQLKKNKPIENMCLDFGNLV